MSNAIPLSIIMVTHNARHFTEQCLHTVRMAAGTLLAETIVVDNASTDGSVAYLQPLFPEMAFVANPANSGFAAACNVGAKLAKGELLLFLNPDTLVSAKALQEAITALHSNEAIGATGMRMVDGSGAYLPESKRGFPWLRTSLFKMSGLYKLMPHHEKVSAYYMGHLPEKENAVIDVMAGAFIMIKKNVFDAIGGFDERYFMYGEDIDLSYAVVQKGYSNYYVGTNAIIHFKGESTQRLSPQYVERFYGAMQLFVSKHYTGVKKRLYNVFVHAARTASSLKHQLMRSSIPESPSMSRVVVVHHNGASISSADAILQSQPDMQGIRYLLPEMLTQQAFQPGDAILFCMDENLTADDCISIMQRLGISLYLFHTIGSHSIVGSPAKNRQGIVMIGD